MTNREVLPKNIKPVKYTLNLTPDFDNFKFKGFMRFDFRVEQPTCKIILNAKQLEIHSFDVMSSDLEHQFGSKITYEEDLDRVHFTLKEELPNGEYYALVNFTGLHNDEMAGFYRSKYTDKEGKEKYLVTTQFEAVDARRAFPCMDEPAHKAKFQVTLNVPKDLVALSNTQVVSDKEVDNNLRKVAFAETPIMSTYLLAFFVGESEYVEKSANLKSGRQVQCRVYTPIGKGAEGVFALNLCCKVLEFYSDFFGIDYPLQKMDMIGIPDFAAGAMENWGLVTYRTKYVLYNPIETSKSLRTTIAYIICHELAHQWFGNLVTMSWWNELWLNEGFATWVGWMATDYCFPEWKVWESFYEQEYKPGMSLDSLTSSHPIEVEINKASQIDEIFDAISYSKGACVIGMLVGFLGLETFREGIRKYLHKHKYANATTENLWEALADESGKPVQKLMSTWTQQMGYPLLKCYGTSDEDSSKLVIKQEKFNNPTGEKTNWFVPLNVLSSKSVSPVLMENDTYEFEYNVDYPVKLNSGLTGFYRVNYDKKLLDNLGQNISKGEFATLDRAGVVDDLFYLARFGYCPFTSAVEFCSNYSNETEYTVLESVVDLLQYTKSVWYDDQKLVDSINEYLLNLLEDVGKQTTFEVPNQKGEDHFVSLRRVLVLGTLADAGHEGVVKECLNRFEKYVNGEKDMVHPDLRGIVFKVAMNKNGDVAFNKLVQRYKTTESTDEKNALLRAFGNGRYKETVSGVLDFAFADESIIRPQDLAMVTSTTSSSSVGRVVLFEYMTKNWDKLVKKLKGGSFLFGRVVGQMIDSFSTSEMLEQIEMFLDDKKEDVSSLEKTINQSKERVRVKIGIREKNTKELKHFFEKESKCKTINN